MRRVESFGDPRQCRVAGFRDLRCPSGTVFSSLWQLDLGFLSQVLPQFIGLGVTEAGATPPAKERRQDDVLAVGLDPSSGEGLRCFLRCDAEKYLEPGPLRRPETNYNLLAAPAPVVAKAAKSRSEKLTTRPGDDLRGAWKPSSETSPMLCGSKSLP